MQADAKPLLPRSPESAPPCGPPGASAVAHLAAQASSGCHAPNLQNQKLFSRISPCNVPPRGVLHVFPNLASSWACPDVALLTQQQAPRPALVALRLTFSMPGRHRQSPRLAPRVPEQGPLLGHRHRVVSQYPHEPRFVTQVTRGGVRTKNTYLGGWGTGPRSLALASGPQFGGWLRNTQRR